MANVEHSVLTGTDLHESKGVAAAPANRVYLTDGAGSGSWTTVPSAAIDAAGVKVFQAQLYHVRDEVSSGTASQGSLTNGTWNLRRLNTEKTNEIGASLGGNQVTLSAGIYYCDGWACISATPAGTSGVSAVRLRNVTDGSTALFGSTDQFFFTSSTTHEVRLPVKGRFTIAGSKTFELQSYVSGPSFSGGVATANGDAEVYAELLIWKVS